MADLPTISRQVAQAVAEREQPNWPFRKRQDIVSRHHLTDMKTLLEHIDELNAEIKEITDG